MKYFINFSSKSVRSAPAGRPNRHSWSDHYPAHNRGQHIEQPQAPRRFGRDAPPLNRKDRVTSMPPMHERDTGVHADFGHPFSR